MGRVLRLFIGLLVISVLLLSGCVYEPLETDLNTRNIYPLATNTYDVGSLALQYQDGYFLNLFVNGVAVGGGGLEIDPVFTASDAFPITAADIANWNALISSQWVDDVSGIHYTGSVGIHTNSSANSLLDLYSSDGISNSPVLSVFDNSASVDADGIHVNMAGVKTDYTDGIYISNLCTSATAGADKYGMRIKSTGNWLGVGSVNNALYIETPTGGTANYSIYSEGAANYLGGSLTLGNNIYLGANNIQTTDLMLRQYTADYFVIMNSANTLTKALRCRDVTLTNNLYFEAGGTEIDAANTDNTALSLKARDNGVGRVEIARIQGAVDPYFQATLPMCFNPIPTVSLPAAPVEGMFTYDATLDKLTYRDAGAWQIVASENYVDSLSVNYAGMYRYDSAVVTTIQQVDDWHLTNGFTTGYLGGGWTFHAGEQLAITAYADNGDGKTKVTVVAHTLINGDIVSISGTTSYDGVWVVEQIAVNTFVIDTPWVADDGASTGEHGSHWHSASATSAGKYLVTYSLSLKPSSANCVVEAATYLNATLQTKSASRTKLGAITDYENVAGFSIVDVAVNNVVSLALKNLTDGGDFTIVDGNMTLVKIGG